MSKDVYQQLDEAIHQYFCAIRTVGVFSIALSYSLEADGLVMQIIPFPKGKVQVFESQPFPLETTNPAGLTRWVCNAATTEGLRIRKTIPKNTLTPPAPEVS